MSIQTIAPAKGLTILGETRPAIKTIRSGGATIVIVKQAA